MTKTKVMTGKQRFEAILKHKRPDKMPLMIPTVACTVASEILGRPAHTGADSLHFAEELALFQGEAAHAEFEEKLIQDTAALAKALRVDIIRETWRMRGKPTKRLDENTLLFGDENGGHTIKRFFPQTQSYGIIKNTNPPETADDIINQIRNTINQTPSKPTKETSLNSISGSRWLFDLLKHENLGEIVPGFGVPFTMYTPAWLEAMALEPALLREYLLWCVSGAIAHMEHLADAGYVFFNGGGDLAGNTGPLFSPALCRQILTDALTQYSNACGHKNVTFCYRTDGDIWKIFNELLVLPGVQAFGEVDRDASMTVGAIRAKHPNLVILGNMSSALLRLGTPQQVREDQRKQLEESQGLNFIPGPSNAIVHGTPVENIFAMIEEIERFVP